jgi:phosphate-selective porin OprO/OprP
MTWRKALGTAAVVGALLLGIRAARGEGAPAPGAALRDPEPTWRVRRDGGPVIEDVSGRWRLGLHGRLMSDWTSFVGGGDLGRAAAAEVRSGHAFRRAWVQADGAVDERVLFSLQVGFERGEVSFYEVCVGLRDASEWLSPLAPDAKVGHFQEPFGMAWLTSSNHLPLTAWPAPTTAFTPGYNAGFVLSRAFANDRVTATVGVFGDQGDLQGTHTWQDGYGVTGRLTTVPWRRDERHLVHVGLSASHRGGVRESRFRTRADVDLGPFAVDTGSFPARSAWLVAAEAALALGDLVVQGEWTAAVVDARQGTDPFFHGFYVEATWPLGAPGRKYAARRGTFAPAPPRRALGCGRRAGLGSLELAARYAYVDLDDGDKRGGRLGDVAVGVSWYLVEHARLMLAYVHARVEAPYGGRNAPVPDAAWDAFVLRLHVFW